MLPNEIEPFADHHIAKLTQILDGLHPEKTANPAAHPKMSDEEVYTIARDARAALTRFKICMDDEVKQKLRYRDMFLANRKPAE